MGVVEHQLRHRNQDASPGNGMPDEGDVISGPRDHWRVLSARPVDTVSGENVWVYRLQQLGFRGRRRLPASFD